MFIIIKTCSNFWGVRRKCKNVAMVLSLKTGLISPKFHVNFDTKLKIVGHEEISSQWKLKAGPIKPRGGRPPITNHTLMQRSGGRNPQPERRSKKLNRFESRHNEPEPGMQNWGKTQDGCQQQSGQGVFDPEGLEQILSIPDKVHQEGFDLKTPL